MSLFSATYSIRERASANTFEIEYSRVPVPRSVAEFGSDFGFRVPVPRSVADSVSFLILALWFLEVEGG